MITKDKLKDMLKSIGFTENKDVYSEFYPPIFEKPVL